MSPYMGGSAPAMANQIADGYSLVTSVQLKRLTTGELSQLEFELERMLRDLRGSVVPQDDMVALQARNRRLLRLTGAVRQVQAMRAQRGRGGG